MNFKPCIHKSILLSICFSFLTLANGQETGFEARFLNRSPLETNLSLLDDFEGDGDLDILLTQIDEDADTPYTIVWLENESLKQFPKRTVTGELTFLPADFDMGDMDNDGDTDFVLCTQDVRVGDGELLWMQRQPDNSFIKWTIEAGHDFVQADLADFDGDGNLDIGAVTSFSRNSVHIYLNDGFLNFTKKLVIDSLDFTELPNLISSGDLDRDGDIDIVLGGGFDRGTAIYWNDGSGNFSFSEFFLFPRGEELSGGFSTSYLEVVDLNGDGVLDILTHEGIGVADLEFFDGRQGFTNRMELAEETLSDIILVHDMDGNGLKDMAVHEQFDGLVSIYFQEDTLSFRKDTLDLNTDSKGPAQLAAGDLDGDGDQDLVSPENGNIDEDMAWFENINGQFYWHGLFQQFRNIQQVRLGDIDQDSDLDIVLSVPDLESFETENEVLAYENIDGTHFKAWRITEGLRGPWDLELADIDNDGDLDAFVNAQFGNSLYWLRNGGFIAEWTPNLIDPALNAPEGLKAVDLDQDGDIDVVGCSTNDNKIFWYANDGQGQFSRRVVSPQINEPVDVEVADLDADNDLDIIMVSRDTTNTLAVFMNDGNMQFTQEILYTGSKGFDLEVGDWTNNQLPDILLSLNALEVVPVEKEVILLFSNQGGGNFVHSSLKSDWEGGGALLLNDLDNDSDLDLIYGLDYDLLPSLRILGNQQGILVEDTLWQEPNNLITGIDIGDINQDGRPDLVLADNSGENLILLTNVGFNLVPDSTSEDSVNENPVSILQALEAEGIAVFPNPLTDRLTVKNESQQQVGLSLFAPDGRLVKEHSIDPKGMHSLFISGMSPGMYILRVQVPQKQFFLNLQKH